MKKTKNPKSSPGYCGIPSKIFRSACDELTLPMTALFYLCIEINRIPDWKIALVRPHYKGKGDKQGSNIPTETKDQYPFSLLFPKSLNPL